MSIKLAHSAGIDGKAEPLRKHITEVAEGCAVRAGVFGAAEEAYLIGYYHDVGKLGEPFQRRLRGEASGIDHWSMGANAAYSACGPGLGRAAMLCILGHHLGIPEGFVSRLRERRPEELTKRHPEGLTLSPRTTEELEALVAEHASPVPGGLGRPFVPEDLCSKEPARAMTRTRALFSALVDSDFRMTEQHFLGPDPSAPKRALDASAMISALESKLGQAPTA